MRILALSGFIPEQICDVVRFTGYEGEYNIAQYCGYAADYISQVINDDNLLLNTLQKYLKITRQPLNNTIK